MVSVFSNVYSTFWDSGARLVCVISFYSFRGVRLGPVWQPSKKKKRGDFRALIISTFGNYQ
jgi:hypothetical protein